MVRINPGPPGYKQRRLEKRMESLQRVKLAGFRNRDFRAGNGTRLPAPGDAVSGRLIASLDHLVNWVLHREGLTVAKQDHEITLPGKYPENEETIMIWLYDHPGHDASTDTFTTLFNPDLKMYEASQERQEALKTTQHAIETLVEQRLVAGDRFLQVMVKFSKLRLTATGEAEAIRQKRRPRTLIYSVPQPDRSKEGSDKPE
jgi:hypothetical protein